MMKRILDAEREKNNTACSVSSPISRAGAVQQSWLLATFESLVFPSLYSSFSVSVPSLIHVLSLKRHEYVSSIWLSPVPLCKALVVFRQEVLLVRGTPKSHRTGKQALHFYFAAQFLFLCEDVVFRAKYISRPNI